jgi:hypothetical protein
MDDPHDLPGDEPRLYGLLGEFASAEQLLHAAKRAADEGYRRVDAYSPLPIEGMSEAIGFHGTRLPLIVLIGGIAGGLLGYGMQYYMAVVSYPLNIGGRPLHSWPAFIPVTFELTILGAALAAVLGMLALNGLPRPHHPLFNVPEFSLATQSRFFLCLEATDPLFDLDASAALLSQADALRITPVEK